MFRIDKRAGAVFESTDAKIEKTEKQNIRADKKLA